MGLHALAYGLAERLDIGRAGTTQVDQEIAVEFGHLRAANGEPAAAGFVDQFPRAPTRRILKGGAAGTVAWLTLLTLLLDCCHLGGDLFGHAGAALQDCRRED